MENKVLGIHHITAIAGNAKRNFDFYTTVLGLRFIKKTVNFDDPGTYHFYFGNESGTPGTILTFFPWERMSKGKQGAGMATEIGYSVPDTSLAFWADRFKDNGVKIITSGERLGEEYLSFEDPDGLPLTLIVPSSPDSRQPWQTRDVKVQAATRGFHSITLTLRSVAETAKILTDIFDYSLLKQDGNRYRFVTHAVTSAGIVDLIEAPHEPAGINAAGTIHHVAFRVANEEVLMHFRQKVLSHGLNITPKIDRNYFFSLYFREPGGVLFELATDNPGFTVDEPLEELGKHLRLPPQYEASRAEIEKVLPRL
ncbi:MAG TPA: ring-cleaving dioxygenase [Chryseosolibacter sp.]|nr:ring-cleaving dioxygenase [Chryseosolibacter sp.]